MTTTTAYLAISLLLIISFTDAARILAVYPIASISHQVAFRPITLELIKHGHEVVVITTDPMFPKGGKEEPPKNLTEIDVHDVSYHEWKVFMESTKGSQEDLLTQMKAGGDALINIINKQWQAKEVKELIKGKQNFDLLLVEACVRQALAFAHIYKVPIIQISSFGAMFDNYDVMGAPTHPLLYPTSMNQNIYNLTMYQKYYELKTSYLLKKMFVTDIAEDENRNLKKHFGPSIPDVRELQKNVDMLFLNVHPIWEGSRPVPPSVIHLGGLPQKPNKELPTDLKNYLDSSKHGVIYISFGTNVKPSLLPPEKIQTLARTFSKLPYDVLWKWDKDVLPGKSDNIRISKWLPQSDLLSAPTHPLLYHSSMSQKLYNLTMYEKIYELKTNYLLKKVVLTDAAADEERLLKKHFGSNVPSIDKLLDNVDLLFLNVHPIWEGSRPVPPNVIHLGGLPQKPNKELPTDLKSYLDSSKHGVIYISFGTNVQPSLLPADKIQVLVRTFSKLPYDVLWKWDKDVLPGKSDNIRISKWLPQSDLLKHPKVKLFVTQGGLQSTDEAITGGVPLIGVPMLGDQWYNVEKYVYHGIGLKLELGELSEELFANTINTVITDQSFRNNIVKLRTLMLDQPQTPLDRAIWWIEYVLRHGGAKHLRSPAANISWSQYLELELVAVVLSALFSLLLVLFGIVYSLYKFILSKLTIKAKVKKN